jgi:hypothetical protein
MNYKNGKYILDDGHIVPSYEAIQIYNVVEFNSRKEEVYDMYLSIHKNVPEDFFDSELIRELTDEYIDELTNEADDLSDILYNICKNAKEK